MSNYDLIIAGTGFASSFFLHAYRKHLPKARVLILEHGYHRDLDQMIQSGSQSSVATEKLFRTSGLSNKQWLFTIGMGGGSNCWWGQTPRQLPEDFELFSRYGRARDWPISYSELVPYYEEVEDLMQIAGSNKILPYPKSNSYPQPPHPLSSFDKKMIDLVGAEQWVVSPTARSSLGTQNRGKCCANGVCGLCPVDAKFRIMNEMDWLFTEDPFITLRTGARVDVVDIEAGQARGVTWTDIKTGREYSARSELVFLGCNALFNPAILLRSGDNHPYTGARLHEQASVKVTIDLTEVDNFDGGTHITASGYMFAAGATRARRGACLIEHYNSPMRLRTERGKWRRRAILKIAAENDPDDENKVFLNRDKKPVAFYAKHSDYALRGLNEVQSELVDLLSPLPIDNISFGEVEPTEGHIQGTVVMGNDPLTSVVDHKLCHHKIPNVLVGGASAFPTGPVANPSLTIAAVSLFAADQLFA